MNGYDSVVKSNNVHASLEIIVFSISENMYKSTDRGLIAIINPSTALCLLIFPRSPVTYVDSLDGPERGTGDVTFERTTNERNPSS